MEKGIEAFRTRFGYVNPSEREFRRTRFYTFAHQHSRQHALLWLGRAFNGFNGSYSSILFFPNTTSWLEEERTPSFLDLQSSVLPSAESFKKNHINAIFECSTTFTAWKPFLLLFFFFFKLSYSIFVKKIIATIPPCLPTF